MLRSHGHHVSRIIPAGPPDDDDDEDELSDMDEGDVDAGAAKQLSKKQQVSSPRINACALIKDYFSLCFNLNSSLLHVLCQWHVPQAALYIQLRRRFRLRLQCTRT